MRVWYVPNRTGDFRLERHPDVSGHSVLTMDDLTPEEDLRVRKFLQKCLESGWVDSSRFVPVGHSEVVIRASVQQAGPFLAADAIPGRGILTVVKSMKGTILTVSDETEPVVSTSSPEPASESKPDATPESTPDAAVSMRRPTICCPTPFTVDGPLVRSSRVLREFCTPSQWRSWVEHGYLYCVGQLSGVTYRIAHRNHPIAELQGKICRDVTSGVTLHFHNSWLPPAEEVLSAKLILENREPWLRHEATMLGGGISIAGDIFKNPLGNGMDGTWDALVLRSVGSLFTKSW